MSDPISTLTRNDQPVVPAGLAAQIQINRATYGVPGDALRTRDVRAKVQDRAASGSGSIRVGEMAEGDDPAYGIVKTLFVEGSVNAKPFIIQGAGPRNHPFPIGASDRNQARDVRSSR